MALRLNNLARLLGDNGRLAEAEPLCQRAVRILLRSSKASGHVLPNTALVLRNYSATLENIGKSEGEILATIESLMVEAGFDPDMLRARISGDEA